jgi:membrane peptidoglycan carboxypeptidase
MCATGRACGTNDHFLERVRILYKDRFPINKGGLHDLDHTRRRLAGRAREGGRDHAATYLDRHPNDPGQTGQMRAGAFGRRLTGDVLAEVGNVNFGQLKYDIIATGWRQPGSTFKIFTYGALVERLTKEVRAAKPTGDKNRRDRGTGARTLHRARRADLRVDGVADAGRKKIENFHSRSEPEYRGNIGCRIAIGESRKIRRRCERAASAGIKNVVELAYRIGIPKDAKHVLQPYPTTAIGASEVNPLSMATTAAFVNGGFRVTPRFATTCVGAENRLLYKDEQNEAAEGDIKGDRRHPQERIVQPAVSMAMIELRQGSARHRRHRHRIRNSQRRDSRNGPVGRRDLEN